MEMDENLSVFISESVELLEDMESALLDMESNPGDDELINRVFRAAHTIKGNAGLFGYDQIIDFTHVMESLLVEVRNCIIPVSSELVSLLIRGKDLIGSLVDELIGKSEADKDDLAEVTALMEKYLEDPHAVALAGQEKPEVSSEKQSGIYTIDLKLGSETFQQGFSPKAIFRELGELGEIISAEFRSESIPALESYDPELCYLEWTIFLDSACAKKEISEIFEFMDGAEVHILPPESSIEEYQALIRQLPNGDTVIGKILVDIGALTEQELAFALSKQKETGKRTGDILVSQGNIQAELVESAVAKQQESRQVRQVSEMLRVNASKLDSLVNLVGELVISGERVARLVEDIKSDDLSEAVVEMNETLEEMRETALSLRMIPIDGIFKRFHRTVRDTSQELGKQIRLNIYGGETELDKTVADKITDPLTHLIRNAIDHGIEKPSERELNNKSPEGKIDLQAFHETGTIVIRVKDDGRGLSREKLLQRAIERKLIEPGANPNDQELFQIIFEPGFSTAAQVSNISGRGVGMDVVKRNIESLRGSVEVNSREGSGTEVTIRLPLTLAIIDGFLISVANESMVIPLDMVVECLTLTPEQCDELKSHRFINLRNEVLPLIDLKQHLQLEGEQRVAGNRRNVVVVQYASRKTGLLVDSLHGEIQTVIKPLGKVFQNLKGFSGFTILGSGNVSMILDVGGLIADACSREKETLKVPAAESSENTSSLSH